MSEDPDATHRGVEQCVLGLEEGGLPEPVDRWELSGGTWRVVSFAEDRATVELLRCDGGEVAEVLTLRQPRELRWAAVQLAVDDG